MNTSPLARVRARGLLFLLALLGVFGFGLLGAVPPAHADGDEVTYYTPEKVSVYDDAKVAVAERLRDQAAQIKFEMPIKELVFYTTDADYSGSFDASVLDYADAKHHEWIEPKYRDKWANGVIIIANNVAQRDIGVYYGEDLAKYIDDEALNDIIDAMTPDLKMSNYTDAYLSGAEAFAEEITQALHPTRPGKSASLLGAW